MIDINTLRPATSHIDVKCHWCGCDLKKRKDAYIREISSRGYCCCRKCFGSDPNFKAARTRVMLTNNPFKGKTHSEETKTKLSVLKKGTPAWNKGIGKYSKRNINIKKWRECRDAVLDRDDYECIKCNAKNSKMHVHHMSSALRFPESQYEVGNCVTLCVPCHNTFHAMHGKRDFTAIQFINWLCWH